MMEDIYLPFVNVGFAQQEIENCVLEVSQKFSLEIEEIKNIILQSELFTLEKLYIRYGSSPVKHIFREINFYKSQIEKKLSKFIEKRVLHSIRRHFNSVFWKAVRDEKETIPTLIQLREIYLKVSPQKPKGEGRSWSRVRDIEKWLKPSKGTKIKYLDVGCSEASITAAIADYLDLKEGEVYGCDISIGEQKSGIVQFAVSSPTSLPYRDEEFDLVTTNQALHHFTDPHIMLSEIYRVLKPGGIYITREHDVRDKAMSVFLDTVHTLYATVFSDEDTPSRFVESYVSFYHSADVWSRKYIEPAGFQFAGYRKTSDMFNSYYAQYIK